MRTYILVALLLASPACAQQTAFVPWTVNEQTQLALKNALSEIPLKYSMNLYNFLDGQEAAAVVTEQAKASREQVEKEKAAHPPTPTPSK